MKVVFVGGGAHRYLGVARSILAEPGMMAGGEINVYDLSAERAGVMDQMIRQSPEFADACCEFACWSISPECILSTVAGSLDVPSISESAFITGSSSPSSPCSTAC